MSVFDGSCSKNILARQYLSINEDEPSLATAKDLLHIRDDTVDLAGQWAQL